MRKLLAKPLNVLLLFVPIALLAEFGHWSPAIIFVTAALAVVPLSGLLGDATEELAGRTGPRVGALLNATLGNAAELIITVLALREGLFDLVRASIIGSIIGNLLLVAGASMIVGGLKHGTQQFSRKDAGLNSTLLILAAMVLVVPSLFSIAIEPARANIDNISVITAGVIIVLYVLSLVFGLTSKHSEPVTRHAAHVPHMSARAAIILLVVSTLFIAGMSEVLVSAVEPMVKQIGISELFVGVILVPIIGNVAEHVVAIEVAAKNKMDLSMGIAVGSSLQVALFVAPLLVFISLFFGRTLDLEFSGFELIALLASCFIAAHDTVDGETNWLEGVMLIGLYIIIAVAFFFVPFAPAVH